MSTNNRRSGNIRTYPYDYNRLWSPYRPTVVYVGTIAIGLAVIEMSESVEMRYVNGKYIRESEYVPPRTSRRYVDHTWTTTWELPCGRLRLVVYAPYRNVSWSISFQETKTRTLTQNLPEIVKTIESSVDTLVEKLKEAARQAELWRLERLAEGERRQQEEDQHRISQSKKDSQEQLSQVIQAWSKVMTLEQFFQGVQDRAQSLPTARRDEVLERLRLAREFVGTQDPLEFFLSWKTPIERYVPMSMPTPDMVSTKRDDDDDDE